MKTKRPIFLFLIIYLCACVTAPAYAYPEGTSYDLPRYVAGSGGNSSASAGYTCSGSAGLISSTGTVSGSYKVYPEFQNIAYSPGTITTLIVQTGDVEGEINLTWSAPGADGTVKTASSYVVKYAVYEISTQVLFEAATTFGQSWSPASPGITENKTLTALDAGTTYYIAVEARNSMGNQAFLSTGTVLTTWAQIDVTAPDAVSDLTALYGADDGEVILQWTAPGDNGTVGNLTGSFRINYSSVGIITSANFANTSSSFSSVVDISTIAHTPLTEYTTTFYDLDAGTSYWFAVKTEDDNNNWSVWTSSADDVSINTLAYAAAQDLVPPVPTELTALAGNTQIKLTWVSVTGEPDLYSYEIWCDSTDPYDFSDNGVLVGEVLSEFATFYHTGLTNECSYVYRINAVDKGSEDGFEGATLRSSYSNEISTVPYLGAPMPPADFMGVAISSVIIEWSWTDNSTTEDGFEIRTDTDGVVIDSVTLAIEIPGIGAGSGGTTSWYQTAGLTANTSSFVQYIHAVSNDYGLSPPTTDAAAPVWTLANNATGCALTVVDISSITLDWSQYQNENPPYTHWGVSVSTDDFSVYTSTPLVYSDNLIEATTILYSLSANCTYSLRICSYNEDEINDWYYDAGSTSTLCNIPGVPTIAETWISSMAVTIDTADNSYWTEYSIKVTSGTDDPAEVQYVQADNTLAAGVVYGTTVTWTDNVWIKNLVANTTHSVSVNARNSNGVLTNYTAAVTSCTHIEKAAGVDFTVYFTSISARPSGTFTNITDGNSGVITYNIDASTGSGWSQNPNWWYEGPDNLTPNTTYSFESNSRNSYGIECGSTTAASTSTLCNIPGVPVVSAIYGSSMTLQLDTTDNSYWTVYSIKVTSGTDEPAQVQYVQADNTLAAGVIYGTTVTWTDNIWLTGLVVNTSHTICVNARNSNGIITEYSQTITTNTLTNPTTGLYVVSHTTYSVTLEWFANDNPAGTLYGLSISSDNFAAFISTFVELSANLTDTTTAAYSLSPNTTYWFRTWTSSDAAGDISLFDGPASTSTLCNIPGVPVVSAIYGSSMTLQLDTADNTYWTEYSIKMTSGTDETAQYLQAGSTLAAAEIIYQSTVTWGGDIWLTDLVANTSHTIYVNARNSNGIITEYSQTVTTDTLPNPTTGLYIVSRTSYSVTLEWFANNNPSSTRYGLSLSSDNFVTDISTFVDISANLTATTTTAYSLLSNTTYWFRTWTSSEAVGDISEYDGPVSTTTYPIAPNVPTDLNADSSQTTATQIKWDFTDAADDEDELYISSSPSAGVYMRISGNLGQLPGTGTATSYIETGLSPNTQYTRYAEAYNISSSSWSVPVTTYTRANTPESLTVDSADKNYIKLSWSPATSGGNAGYAVERATDTGGEWSFIAAWADNLTGTTTTNYGLSAATSYYYRVYGYNGAGIITGNYDGPVSTMTVPDNDPPAVSTATVIDLIYFEGNKAVIDVTVADDAGITEVTLLYRQKGDTLWQETSFIPAPSTTTSYIGLAVIPGSYITTAGVQYYIRVYDGMYYGYWKSAALPQEITVTKTYAESAASGDVTVPDENPDDGSTGIYIPAGALDSAVPLTIVQKKSADELPATETSIDTKKNGGKPIAIFEFGPDGTKFKIPVTLTIVYFDDVINASGVDETRLQMYWYNSGEWKSLGGTVNASDNTVSAKTVRFSKYALFASKKVSITAGEKTFLTPYLPVQFSDVTELTVYDIKGNTVIELESLSGTSVVTWDGKDETADMVESGAYIYKATTVTGDETYGVIVVAK